MSILSEVSINLVGDLEYPLSCFQCCSRIIGCILVSEKSISKHATNYTTLQFIDKDTDTVINEINTDSEDEDGIDIVSFVPIILNGVHQLTQDGNKVITFKKFDNGDSVDMGKCLIRIESNGFNYH